MRRVLSLFLAWLALVVALFSVGSVASARVSISVDLGSQTMRVVSDDGQYHTWAVSSGKPGYRTPTGVFRVQAMKRYHFSRKYHGAMPYSLFFRGGYAIHGTSAIRRLGRPDSHGCVRLSPAHAAKLFALVRAHGAGSARIDITGSPLLDGKTVAARRIETKRTRPRGNGAGETFFGPLRGTF